LDPAGEVVEDVRAVAPLVRPVPRVGRVLPEAALVVERPERLAELLLGDALRHDPAPEQHLPEPGALLLEEGDQLERQAARELLVDAADLERRYHPHGAVVAAAVPGRVAV